MNIVEIFIVITLFSYLIYGIYVLNIAKKDYSKVNLNDLDLIPSMFTVLLMAYGFLILKTLKKVFLPYLRD